jgi:hypothetical protein
MAIFNYAILKEAMREAGYEVSNVEHMIAADFAHLRSYLAKQFGVIGHSFDIGLRHPETLPTTIPGHPDADAVATPAPVAAPVAEAAVEQAASEVKADESPAEVAQEPVAEQEASAPEAQESAPEAEAQEPAHDAGTDEAVEHQEAAQEQADGAADEHTTE